MVAAAVPVRLVACHPRRRSGEGRHFACRPRIDVVLLQLLVRLHQRAQRARAGSVAGPAAELGDVEFLHNASSYAPNADWAKDSRTQTQPLVNGILASIQRCQLARGLACPAAAHIAQQVAVFAAREQVHAPRHVCFGLWVTVFSFLVFLLTEDTESNVSAR